MRMRPIISLVFFVALILSCNNGTPTPPPPPSEPPIPEGYNSANIDGSSGTPAGGLPVTCPPATGNVTIPPHSFEDTQTIKLEIECVVPGSSQHQALQTDFEDEFGFERDLLGAIEVEPSPFSFDNFVTLIIPLFDQQTVGTIVDVFLYTPDQTPKFQQDTQALVLASGWEGQASVDHFSTFVVVGPASVGQDIVPDVIGMDEAAARATLEGAGFGVLPVRDSVVEVVPPQPQPPAMIVSDQQPPAGTQLALGNTVQIRLRLVATATPASAKPSIVPDVRFRDPDTAQAILERAGFRVVTRTDPEDYEVSSPPGAQQLPAILVTDQEPQANTQLPPGSPVQILIQRVVLAAPTAQPPPEVPDVIGMDANAARDLLIDTGYDVLPEFGSQLVIVTPAAAGQGKPPAIMVTDQDPKGGTPLALGGVVQIHIQEVVVAPAVRLVTPVNGEFLPDLAIAWEVSEDASVWTFVLDEGRAMVDGEPYVSSVVAATLDKNQDQLTGYLATEEIDDYTIQIFLAQPNPQLLVEISKIEMPRTMAEIQ